MALTDNENILELTIDAMGGHLVSGRLVAEKWHFSKVRNIAASTVNSRLPRSMVQQVVDDQRIVYGCKGVKDGSEVLLEIADQTNYRAVSVDNPHACVQSNDNPETIIEAIESMEREPK